MCSPWNSPNPDYIVAAVLLNVLFLPTKVPHVPGGSARDLWLLCFTLTILGRGTWAKAKAVTEEEVQQ